ncbi:MAG: beta-lactamase family protein [Actinobacteria bacterium]|nr:beta-lactamase family protein [Actinomycetota bacterium]
MPAQDSDLPEVHGGAEDGFGAVVDAFVDNFRLRGDRGAGCTVFVDGRAVVDVWAGEQDSRSSRPWQHGTAAALFSCSKGLLALIAYLLVQDGLLDLDRPVARYWPEFAAHGKDRVTVREVLAHRAGLPAVESPMTRDEVCAWFPAVQALEQQTPLWPPGSAHSYHPVTLGWLVGEVVRRVTGVLPGTFFSRRVASPRGLDVWIGVPWNARDAVAWMEAPLPDDDSAVVRRTAEVQSTAIVHRAMTMGSALPFPTDSGVVTLNDPQLQAAELPGINGFASAPSMARLYAGCVSDIDGPALLTPQSVEDALVPRSWGQMLLGDPDLGQRWGTGFMISSPPSRPMLGPRSFGHDGAGGQLAFADPDLGVGFAYLSCQMGPVIDHRANELTRALGRCLGTPEPSPTDRSVG